MATTDGSATCEACGRELPAHQGRGRRRRYCDDRCRDAARRARARAASKDEPIVNKELTALRRQDYVYSMQEAPDAPDPVAAAVRDTAQRLLAELARTENGSPLDTVAAARELSAAAG